MGAISMIRKTRNRLFLVLAISLSINLISAAIFVYSQRNNIVQTEIVFAGEDNRGRCVIAVEHYYGKIETEWQREFLRKSIEAWFELKNVAYIGKTEWKIKKSEPPPKIKIDKKEKRK